MEENKICVGENAVMIWKFERSKKFIRNNLIPLTKSRVLLMLILTALFAFLFIYQYNRREYIDEQAAENTNNVQPVGEINSSMQLKQEFSLPKHNAKIRGISIFFATYADTIQTQGIRFVLYDKKGTELFSQTVSQEELADNAYYTFSVDDIAYEKGSYYILQGLDVADGSAVSPTVWLTEATDSFGTLYINGEKDERNINTIIYYSYFNYFPYIILILEWMVMTFLFVVRIPSIKKKRNRYIALPIVCVANMVFIEYTGMIFGNFREQILVPARVITCLLLFLFVLCIYGISGNVMAAMFITDLCYLCFVIASYFVVSYRHSPIVPADVYSIKTLSTVVGNYKISFDTKQCICMIAFLLFSVISFLILKGNRKKEQKRSIKIRIFTRCICAVGAISLLVVLANGKILNRYGLYPDSWTPERAYYKNGPLANFWVYFQYMRMKKPVNYSADAARKILERYPEISIDSDAVKPNIILIMNESLADFSSHTESGTLRFSEEPLSFIHGLSENTVKGNCLVSIFGANTPNSEFEALTGNSLAFFPSNTVVYQMFPHEIINGITGELKSNSYACTAIHPLNAGNYNRINIYNAMGFDEYLAEESFGEQERVRVNSFISDKATYEKIIDIYENKPTDTPMFALDITMQNHGGYDLASSWERPVLVEERDFPLADEYLSSTKVSDDAFAFLVNYFENQEEPTVIMMFGDHQPSIETDFFNELFGVDFSRDDLSLQDIQKRYFTPYVLWANYDIPEETKDVSANALSVILKQAAGLPLSPYEQFIEEFHRHIALINANGYQDENGEWHELKEKNEYLEWIQKYEIVQYYMYSDEASVDSWDFRTD